MMSCGAAAAQPGPNRRSAHTTDRLVLCRFHLRRGVNCKDCKPEKQLPSADTKSATSVLILQFICGVAALTHAVICGLDGSASCKAARLLRSMQQDCYV
jgi:hypothetical protein